MNRMTCAGLIALVLIGGACAPDTVLSTSVLAPIAPAKVVAPDDQPGGEDCYAHEITWDWSVQAWHDYTSQPAIYYDLDPYANCSNASFGRGPEWGDEWGDGAGYLYWDYVDRLGDDVFDVVATAMAECPLCTAVQIAQKVAQSPVVQAEAIAIGASLGGLAQRATNAAIQNGPRIAAQIHHIMTNKNAIASPQWTGQFNNLLSQVGMRVTDAANRVSVQNHVGQHPQSYHQYVYNRIAEAIGGGRQAVEEVLRELALECVTQGTLCNTLITSRGP